jgi:hypothetical protein
VTYYNNEGGKYADNFVQQLRVPGDVLPADFVPIYEKFARRILWMDGTVCPGAFQMNTSWYCTPCDRDPIFTEHVHNDTSELIGFFGSNPDDPYDLNATIQFTIEGETHELTRSTMIWVPAGMRHNPLRLIEVRRPIFHFSVVTTESYDGSETYK